MGRFISVSIGEHKGESGTVERPMREFSRNSGQAGTCKSPELRFGEVKGLSSVPWKYRPNPGKVIND
jgi:hypothetical protein